jgi:hypothetical protein
MSGKFPLTLNILEDLLFKRKNKLKSVLGVILSWTGRGYDVKQVSIIGSARRGGHPCWNIGGYVWIAEEREDLEKSLCSFAGGRSVYR